MHVFVGFRTSSTSSSALQWNWLNLLVASQIVLWCAILLLAGAVFALSRQLLDCLTVFRLLVR